MVRMLELTENDRVLEPSAGVGHLILAIGPEHPHTVAVEIDPERCSFLRERFPAVKVYRDDFLGWSAYATQSFDAVVMNPPFTNNQDLQHIRRAWNMLRPGGRLVTIASPHSGFASDRMSVDFRSWLAASNAVTEELPVGTFSASGTDVPAQLIMARKPQSVAHEHRITRSAPHQLSLF
jgi:16S rRNA G1207 methylase RsmC